MRRLWVRVVFAAGVWLIGIVLLAMVASSTQLPFLLSLLLGMAYGYGVGIPLALWAVKSNGQA